jgi:hypothetical protein
MMGKNGHFIKSVARSELAEYLAHKLTQIGSKKKTVLAETSHEVLPSFVNGPMVVYFGLPSGISL